MPLHPTRPCLGLAWNKAVGLLPQKFRLDHSPDQYGVDQHFSPPEYQGPDGARTLTPPSAEEVYRPIKEPFLVPPKYRKQYNFSVGHGRYLYTKDPLWMEARERYWDDQQMATQIHRRNYEHMRKQYRKQWHDAHRYNLDEYLAVMNRVTLEEKVEQDKADEDREKHFKEDLARLDAIHELKEKRRKLIIERWWKRNVYMYERYSEQLQYLSQEKEFMTFDNMDAMLAAQADRWSVYGGEMNKLNMFGRIPYQEEDCIPQLDVQYLFQKEDLSADGREAYRRLVQVYESSSSTLLQKQQYTSSHADYDMSEALGDAEIDTVASSGTSAEGLQEEIPGEEDD
eukprot:TRINITY_DN16419_c0_g2_i1.p1 TRINITY_DN16419_c0_g2~~TRINITY_DN16419_c0_g2_i1.p1  ORF type:complete len:364 (+),score=165.69 TRINITY_DN16419_c0_g2_i1:72-1094(+)